MKRLLIISFVFILCLACLCSCSLFSKPCEHSEVVDAAVTPTCTEAGLTEGKHCSACGEVTVAQQVIAPLGHTEVLEESKKATCTEDGYTASVHCSVCNAEIIAKEIIPAAHTYGEWEEVEAPDCFFDGEKQRTCSVCDYVDSENVAKIEHSFALNEKNSLFTCEHCNATIYSNHLYAAIDVQGDWYSSYKVCDELGGYLATITSEDEQNVINALMVNAERNIYWVGGLKNSDGWEWITGEKFEYTNWYGRQPDNAASNEWFLQVYGGGAAASNLAIGQWNDLNLKSDNHGGNLHNAIGLICEWELEINESTHYFTEWETVTEFSCFGDGEEYRMCVHCGLEETRTTAQIDHNFIFNEATGIKSCEHCGAVMYDGRIYKIFTTAVTWFDAYTMCENMGGHLVTVTSAEEQTFIETYMTSENFTSRAWIGAYHDGESYKWVTGEKFDYANWRSGLPDCYGQKEYFAHLNFDAFGDWNDLPPYGDSTGKPYVICEWETN